MRFFGGELLLFLPSAWAFTGISGLVCSLFFLRPDAGMEPATLFKRFQETMASTTKTTRVSMSCARPRLRVVAFLGVWDVKYGEAAGNVRRWHMSFPKLNGQTWESGDCA